MKPRIKLTVKKQFFQYLWLKQLTGFDQSQHCEKCLRGKRLTLIPAQTGYPAGFTVEGELDPSEHYVYLCGVSPFSRYYPQHLHVLMAPDADASFVHEDDNVRVEVSGMRRIPIEPVPGTDGLVPDEYRTCRNWQAAWHLFPGDRKPLAEVPGVK